MEISKKDRAYISPTTKKLIITEAIKEPRLPRSILAENLLELLKKEYGEDAPLPAKETLVKLISRARNIDTKAWSLGMMRLYHNDINPEAIPYILAVQNWLEKQDWVHESREWLGRKSHLTVKEALWIARLFRTVQGLEDYDVACLYRAASWYATHEIIHEMSNKDDDNFDTTEIDTALRTGKMQELYDKHLMTAFEESLSKDRGKSKLFEAGDKLNGSIDENRSITYIRRQITKFLIDEQVEKDIKTGILTGKEIDRIREELEFTKNDAQQLDLIAQSIIEKNKKESRPEFERILNERYGELTTEQVDMFIDCMYSDDYEKWIQDHPEFVTEMQEKEEEDGTR